MNVPESLELTRPGRGNFDLYEDGLAPQGWILPPEGGPSEEQKRGADVSAPFSSLLGPPSTPPVDVPGGFVWIVPPEDGYGGEPKRDADVSAPFR